MKKIINFAFLLCTFTLYIHAQTDARVSSAWRVLKYDVSATVPTNDRYLTVRATMNLLNVGNGAGTRLTLRISEKAEITTVQLNGAVITSTKGEEPIGGKNIQRIIINLPAIQPNATFTIAVDYRLKVDENSGLNAISPLGAQFLPLSFWYPTPNSHYAPRGADYAPFQLSVTSSNGTVISSGIQTGASFNQKLNGQPFFLTGNWDSLESKGVTVFLPKGATADEKKRGEELAGLMAEANTFTASLLGSSPNVPLKIVAVRRGSGFSESGTVLLDYGTFRRQKIDSGTAMIIAESVAKIWLGNVKAVRGEGFGVIHEGLSRYIATQFIEKQFGKDSADNERFRQRTAYALVAKNEQPYNIISPLDGAYFSAVASKGAMIWRVIAKNMGQEQFFNLVKAQEVYSLAVLNSALPNKSDVLNDSLINANETNLLAGLPQISNGLTKVAVRNTGNITVTVNVLAITDKGERLVETTTIQPKSFGEVSFKTTSKIIRTEIDPEKFYPQIDYSDDVAPREFVESNPLIAVKRAFDKQDFLTAEKNTRTILQSQPHLDDARTWLGRALLAQNKLDEAEKEFQTAIAEKLPTSNTLAWANVGLGDIALKSNKNTNAATYYNEAIKADVEYGATLAARVGRQKAGATSSIDESVKAFFTQFDKAIVAGRKAEIDNLFLSGEVAKFSSGISGQAEQWQTQIVSVDKIDANSVLVEVNVSTKMLNREPSNGTAVFQLSKDASNWKISGVEIFEVR
jgi:tetratricopeptide (TPR) repeat protein